MTHRLMIALCLGAALVPIQSAYADTVSDRVVLVTTSGGCPSGSMSFRRQKQEPDGRWTYDTGEFAVPAGTYLEITSIEYSLPYATHWAGSYVQSLDVTIRQRVGSASTSIFNTRYRNAPMYDEDENDKLHTFGQFAGLGPLTQVASFPVGPLMSSAGRLCATASGQFWTYSGSVRVRGRLIASGGEIIREPPGGGVLNP